MGRRKIRIAVAIEVAGDNSRARQALVERFGLHQRSVTISAPNSNRAGGVGVRHTGTRNHVNVAVAVEIENCSDSNAVSEARERRAEGAVPVVEHYPELAACDQQVS